MCEYGYSIAPYVRFKDGITRQIAINDLAGGGGDLKDIPEHMAMAPDGAITAKIQELKDLMSRQPIGRIRGPIADKISKLSGYGDHQVHWAKVKIGKIRRELKDFVRHQKGRGAPSGGITLWVTGN